MSFWDLKSKTLAELQREDGAKDFFFKKWVPLEEVQKLEKVLKIANQRIEAFERVTKAFAEDEAKIAEAKQAKENYRLFLTMNSQYSNYHLDRKIIDWLLNEFDKCFSQEPIGVEK
jgi:hypothetical protein